MGSTKKKKNNKNKNNKSATKSQPQPQTNNGTSTTTHHDEVVDSVATVSSLDPIGLKEAEAAAALTTTTTTTSDPIVPIQLNYDQTTTTTTTTASDGITEGTVVNNDIGALLNTVKDMNATTESAVDTEKIDDDWESVAQPTGDKTTTTTTPVETEDATITRQEQTVDEDLVQPTDLSNESELETGTATTNETANTNTTGEENLDRTTATSSTVVDETTQVESSVPEKIVVQVNEDDDRTITAPIIDENNNMAATMDTVVTKLNAAQSTKDEEIAEPVSSPSKEDEKVVPVQDNETDVVDTTTTTTQEVSIVIDTFAEPTSSSKNNIAEAKSTDSTPTITNRIVVDFSTDSIPGIGILPSNSNSDNLALSIQVFGDVLQTDYYDCLGSAAVDQSKLLVGAIDQGTSSTRFVVFTHRGRIAACSQMEHTQYYPQTGWHEQDPIEIWNKTVTCIADVINKLQQEPYNLSLGLETLASIGITNQRETTIAWNRRTGQPYYNAIVWDCARTSDIADDLAAGDTALSHNRFRSQTGLPLSSYFAGTKVKWLLDNVDALQDTVRTNPSEVCFGTIDTWLLYQLTGQQNFQTDVSNASRWLFLNLQSCRWDKSLVDTICAPHQVPLSSLPEICPSSYIFGTCTKTIVHDDGADRRELGLPDSMIGVPIASVLGDQQAALFGQAAFQPGEAKNTYGTGLFLMMNTGTQPVPSKHGLLTTVAYQIGKDGPVHYALEGSVAFSGSTIQWLRDQLGIIRNASESEAYAASTSSNEGLYFVPAFSGLLAPYWRSDARGCIVGMSASHHKGHICRAALESTAYQTKSVFDAITADSSGIPLQKLNVDGGGTHNRLLMQFQADIINVPVVRPVVMETTSMGAAFAAGLATGVWSCLGEIRTLWAVAETYHPRMSKQDREHNWNGWIKAVDRSFGWIDHAGSENTSTTTTTTSVPSSSESTTTSKRYSNAPEEESSNDNTNHRSLMEEDSPNTTSSSTGIIAAAVVALGIGFALGSVRRNQK